MKAAACSNSKRLGTTRPATRPASMPARRRSRACAAPIATAAPLDERERRERTPPWLRRWFDSRSEDRAAGSSNDVDWLRCLPFLAMHIAALGVFWTGWSPVALAVAAASFLVRMFAITGFYHRYFSHRAFRTSRAFQALMAFVGGCAAQRDPMWWASHHAQHHSHSDAPGDPHSPSLSGFLGSHAGWFMTGEGFLTRSRFVRDWARFPELRLLNRFDWVPPLVFAALVYLAGWILERWQPQLGTNGPQMLAWGFFASTVCLYHATFTINSLAHGWGHRRFATGDDSRNNWLLALLTLGEGWHNNHHHYPGAARQGFYWWELDITYYVLLSLQRLGLVWNLRTVPEHALARNRVDSPAAGGSR